MNQPEHERREQLELLLAERATSGLSESQTESLQELLNEFPDFDADHYERAASAFGLAFHQSNGANKAPASLMDKLSADADMFFGSADLNAESSVSSEDVREVVDSSTSERSVTRVDGSGSINWFASAGWIVALAATVLLFFQWRSPINSTPQAPTLVQRSSKLAALEGTVEIAWAEGKHPFENEVNGSVLWNQQLQEGYMRFAGLPANDPSQSQYQLWIIDPERDAEPIDGGVFDSSGESEVIVPIDAKLRTINPQAFAITIEKPGGVVVSDQSQLPLIAAVTAP